MKIKFLIILISLLTLNTSNAQDHSFKGRLVFSSGKTLPKKIKLRVHRLNAKKKRTEKIDDTRELVTTSSGHFYCRDFPIFNYFEVEVIDDRVLQLDTTILFINDSKKDYNIIVFELFDFTKLFTKNHKGNFVSLASFYDSNNKIDYNKINSIVNSNLSSIKDDLDDIKKGQEKTHKKLEYLDSFPIYKESYFNYYDSNLKKRKDIDTLSNNIKNFKNRITELSQQKNYYKLNNSILKYKYRFYGCQGVSKDKRTINFRLLVTDSLNIPIKTNKSTFKLPLKISVHKITGIKGKRKVTQIKSQSNKYYYDCNAELTSVLDLSFVSKNKTFFNNGRDFIFKIYDSTFRLLGSFVLSSTKNDCFVTKKKLLSIHNEFETDKRKIKLKIKSLNNFPSDFDTIDIIVNHIKKIQLVPKKKFKNISIKLSKGRNEITIKRNSSLKPKIFLLFNKEDPIDLPFIGKEEYQTHTVIVY